jgi:hypothetical protein
MIILYRVLKASLLSFVLLSTFGTAASSATTNPQTPTVTGTHDSNDTNQTLGLSPAPDKDAIIDLGNPDTNNCVDITHFHRYPNYTHELTVHSMAGRSWVIMYTNWSQEYNSTNKHQRYHMNSTEFLNGKSIHVIGMDVDVTETFVLNTRNAVPLREITKRVAIPTNHTYDGISIGTGGPGISTYAPYSLFPTKLCQGASLSKTYYVNEGGSRGNKQVSRLDVVEIGVRKCVKAGCFNTVHLHYISTSPVDLEGDRWMDIKTGVLVYSNHTSQEMELVYIDQ